MMTSLELFCPDIGSRDFVHQFRSKAINSFILSDQLICSAANLHDKFKRTQVARRLNQSLWAGVSLRTVGRQI